MILDINRVFHQCNLNLPKIHLKRQEKKRKYHLAKLESHKLKNKLVIMRKVKSYLLIIQVLCNILKHNYWINLEKQIN